MRERIPAHRSPRCLAAAALALFAAGCTGPVPPPAAPQAPTPPVATPAPSAPAASRTPVPVGSTLRVVGIGDSVMAGTNCGCAGPVAAYAERMRSRHPGARVDTLNRGVPGATTADLSAQLARDADLRRALAEADVVLVVIGANDMLRAADRQRGATPEPSAVPRVLDQLAASVDRALADVAAAGGGRPARYLVAGYWNLFPEAHDRDVTLASAAVTRAGNTLIADAAARHGMTYVDLDGAFAAASPGDVSPLLSDDDLHPNARGVQVIADAFAAAS